MNAARTAQELINILEEPPTLRNKADQFIAFAEFSGVLIKPHEDCYWLYCRKIAAARVIRSLSKNEGIFDQGDAEAQIESLMATHFSAQDIPLIFLSQRVFNFSPSNMRAVSYTHLTLPTTPYV